MSTDRESTAGLLGLLGAGIALCCGLPLLLGAGVAVGVAGLALGSGLVIAAGVALAVWGWRRRRQHRCASAADAEWTASARPTEADGP